MHSRSAYIPRQWCELACQACYKVCILCATRYDRVSEHYTHLQHLMCAFSGAVPGTTVAGTFHASCQLPTLFSRRQGVDSVWGGVEWVGWGVVEGGRCVWVAWCGVVVVSSFHHVFLQYPVFLYNSVFWKTLRFWWRTSIFVIHSVFVRIHCVFKSIMGLLQASTH